LETVQIEEVTSEEDIAELRELIRRHQMYTGSEVASRVLDQWPHVLGAFRRVMPIDYLKAMQQGVATRQNLEPVR
jgi:glutamate synthase domain-containing protein 3